jgi:hypothetical protein
MRAYAREDEERVHLQAQVRAWTSARLLADAQGAALESQLRTDLRRTNVMLRAVLALFTAIITAATLGLIYVTLQVRSDAASSVLLAMGAAGCLTAAELAVAKFRVYRFGVEEAWAAGGVLLAALSASIAASLSGMSHSETAGFAVAAVSGVAVYQRYGAVYALIAGIACAAAIPFQLGLPFAITRIAAASGLAGAFLAFRTLKRRHEGSFIADEYAIAQATAWAGVYLVINLQIQPWRDTNANAGWFYWATYAAVWLLPAAGLQLAIREKDRSLIAVNLLMALGTLATNKAYLGSEHQSWDPMLLGVLLMAAAIGVRRWLLAGPDGQRNGYTPLRILDADRELIRVAANLSAGFRPATGAAPVQPDPRFGGGRSGGGGASGAF